MKEQYLKLSTASIHEAAGKIGNLPSEIKPLSANFKLFGRTFTVQSPPGDNLWIHRAIYAANPGDILVVNVSGQKEHGYFGDIMATAAQERGLSGLIIDGGVRDSQTLIEINFPVFSNGICIAGTNKDPNRYGSLGQPIRFGNVIVRTGDLVVGDADGIVVIPKDEIESVLKKAQEREEAEANIIELLKNGQSTIEIYHLPD